MYRGYLAFAVLFVRINSFVLEDVDCDHIYNHDCHENSTDYPQKNNNRAILGYCTEEDIPKKVHFVVLTDESKISEYPGTLKVHFPAPKTNCKFGVSLLVNASIQNDVDCANYNFVESNDLDAETHTTEKSICVAKNNAPHSEHYYNSTTMCKDNMALWFQYIFTGCYAIRFHIDGHKYVVSENQLLRTDYTRTEVVEPVVRCTYDGVKTTNVSKELVEFAVDGSMLVDTADLMKLELWSDTNQSDKCNWYSQSRMYTWTINVDPDAPDNNNCSVNIIKSDSGRYLKTATCKFIVEATNAANYCFTVRLFDERCKKYTLWNPPADKRVPCTWMKRCVRAIGSSFGRERIDAHKRTDNNSYLLLPVVVIILTMFTMFGMIYFLHYVRIRNGQLHYLHAQKPAVMNSKAWSAKFNGTKVSNLVGDDKEMECNTATSKNIVLLYPKSSESFMALMADFRGILTRVCQCAVHDWYDGTVWNQVAKIGGPEWFSEMLNNGCRVIWIDTPAMRSLVTSRFRKGLSSANCERNKFVEVGDFRDGVFPVILNLAKRSVQETPCKQSRHFIVRLKRYENFEDENDPFADISSGIRYHVPEDLSQLCSHLSILESNAFIQDTRMEEDFIRQHLSCVQQEPF